MDQNPDEVERAMLGGDRLGDPTRIPAWQRVPGTTERTTATWGPLPPIPEDCTLAAACQWSDPPIGGDHLVEDRRVWPKLLAWLTGRKRNAA